MFEQETIVENLDKFLNRYRTSDIIRSLNERIESGVVENVGVRSAVGSSKSVLIAATYENQRKHYVVLCGDKEEAANHFNT